MTKTTQNVLFRLLFVVVFFFTASCGNQFTPGNAGQTLESSDGDQILGENPDKEIPDANPPVDNPEDDSEREPLAAAKYFRLMVHGDGARSATIGFAASSEKASDHRVYFDTLDHGRNVKLYRQNAQPQVIHNYLEMNNAFVRLTNLSPDTAYYFVVQDPKGVSERFWFKTSPAGPNARLSVIAGGDSRNNRTPRKAANLMVSKLRPHIIMFSGDMTGGGSPKEWREWFEDWQLTISPDGRIYPLLAARGNHESSNEMIAKLFDTTAGVYFASSFAGSLLRIYTLNTESGISGDQTSWLNEDLTANHQTRWKFAQYHKPIRPHTKGKSEGSNQYRNWAPLFEKHGVQLVSEADSHTVKTTWPIRPSSGQGSDEGFVRDDINGTIYIGEGCWGAPLRSNDDTKSWTRDSGRFNHFHWIFVDQNRIEIRVVKVDNAKEVAALTDQNLFAMPAGIDIWKPANGSVVVRSSNFTESLVAEGAR